MSKVPVLMRSVSGIRGVVGEGLTPEVLVSHVHAFLALTQARRIVLGRDSRPTGEQITELVSGVCRMAGAEVIHAGLATTPTVELLVEQHGAQGGIIITASHNPVQWNALKFVDAKGMFLGPDAAEKLFTMADSTAKSWPGYQQVAGSLVLENSAASHIEAVLACPFVDVPAVRAARLRVAVDAVNGAGAFAVPELLEAMGCEVVRIHCKPDGTFPRGAEPVAESLGDLGRAVVENGCAVGFALDPDADRCALVDATGQAIGEEYTLAIAVETVLQRKLGPVCINLSSSRMSEDIAEAFGQKSYRSKVGEINVSLLMIDKGAIIGGEGNGGVILPSLHYGRDSLIAAALVVDWMARHSKGIADFVQTHERYEMVKRKLPVAGDVRQVFNAILAAFPDWQKDERDGLWLGQGKQWVHVRASNTEPVIRIIAEAAHGAEALCDKVQRIVEGS